MDFNFSLENTQTSAIQGKYFKPYTINKVNSIKAELTNGTKGETNWKALDITFSNDEGYSIRERYFIPGPEKGLERNVYNGEPCFVAPYEELKQLVVHILGVFCPSGFEQLKKAAPKCKSMEQFLGYFVQILTKAPKKEVEIKVVGRKSSGKIYAALPKCCGLSKIDGHYTAESEIFPINIIGEGLEFTSYEMKKKQEYENAKPTPMPDTSNVDLTSDSKVEEDDDIDLASLDLESL